MTHLLNLMDGRSISPPSSINSCSRESEDINSKYHRLASQFAQLRAQVVVLKKALLDERERHCFIKDNDVGKAQKIRTLEQEVDSLTFRNKQLSSRVDNLQQDFDNGAKKKPSKTKNAAVSNKDTDSIHLEELEAKIRENEILHNKLQTVEERFTRRISSLEEENYSLSSSKLTADSVLKTSQEEFELSLSKEQRRSSTLQVQADKLQSKLDAANAALAQKSRSNRSSPDQNGKIGADEVRLIKCKNLNIFAKDKKRSTLVESTVEMLGGYVGDLVTSLQNYTTYLHQRTQLYSSELGEALTPASLKLCEDLSQSSSHIKPLQDLYSLFATSALKLNFSLKCCGELAVFSQQFTAMTEHLCKVLASLKRSLREESMSMSCSLQMEESNGVISETLQPLSIALQNTAFSLDRVTEISDSTTATNYLPSLISDLGELCSAIRSHLSALHPKLTLVHKLPTTTQRLKTTDECCVASLQSSVNTLTRISKHLEDNIPILTKPSRFSAEQESPYTPALISSCISYLDSINSTLPNPGSPGTPSPEPVMAISPSPELSNEIAAAKGRIAKLEQGKEHWMLEAQLLNIKLEKANKQVREFQQSKTEAPSNVPVDTLLDLSDTGTPTKSAVPWDDSGLREEAIRLHFTSRVKNLAQAIQKAEGECLLYKKECIGLKKRIQISEKQQNQTAIDICNSDMSRKQLDEELALTKDKYESQLALMSEHLCAMNDKLVNLNEENQSLKMDTPKQSRKKW